MSGPSQVDKSIQAELTDAALQEVVEPRLSDT